MPAIPSTRIARATPSYDRTFRKAIEAVTAKPQTALQIVDHKLFDYLLYVAHDALTHRPVHSVPVRDCLKYIGGGYRVADLEDSLLRLGGVNVEIRYKDEGQDHLAIVHFLSADLCRAENGELRYAFDPIMLTFLNQPNIYAAINLMHARSFRRIGAKRLYEHALLYVKRYHPVWKVSLEELRQICEVGDAYPRYSNFRRKILEPAVEEVNQIAGFVLDFEQITAGDIKTITHIQFKPRLKTKQELDHLRPGIQLAGSRKVRDAQTTDIFDGRSDEQRRGRFVLYAETRDLAALLLEKYGVDREAIDFDEYQTLWEQSLVGADAVRDPHNEFLLWLDVHMKRQHNPALDRVDGGVVARFIKKR
jgi:hypothetical protein